MEHKLSPVNVTISGADSQAVRTVAAVVGDGLVAAGFSEVSVVSLNPEPRPYLESSESLLETIGRTRPHLLRTPVTVQYFDTEEQPPRDELSAFKAEHSGVASAGVEPSRLDQLQTEVEMAQEATWMAGVVDDPVAADPGPGSEEVSP